MKITSTLLLLSASLVFATTDNADYSSTQSSFEESLKESSYTNDPVYKLRENLLNAVKEKDTATVTSTVEQLASMETRSFIPIRDPELEVVYIETKMFKSLLDMLDHHYKTLLDTTRFDRNPDVASKDGLSLFVANALNSRDTTDNVFYAIEKDIQRSSLSEQQKEKLEMLLLLRDAYRRTDAEQRVRKLAERYVKNNSQADDVEWVRKCILAPLLRMDIEEYRSQRTVETKDYEIEQKLYTGGLGLNVYFLKGGFGAGFDKFYRKDLFEAETLPINLEAYLQFSRVALLGDLASFGVVGVNSYGLGIGFVAYDSRYLKIRPYFRYGFTYFSFNYRYNYKTKDVSGKAGEYDESKTSGSYTFAADIDYKFATPHLFSSNKFVSFAVASRVGLSYIDIDNEFARGKGVSGFFCIGLGVYFW